MSIAVVNWSSAAIAGRFARSRGALPSKAELCSAIRYVQQVPEPDIRPRA
jgi:hypothetical protein